MTTIRSTEDPAVRFAKLSAEMFYYLADELIKNLGEEKGKAAVQNAVKNFGEKRVADMSKEASERNLPMIPQTYFKVRDMPSNGWENDPENPMAVKECPMFDMWKNFGENGMKIGALYCEIDHILFDGFGFSLDRPRCKTKGDSVCDFKVGLKEGSNNSGKD